MNRITPVARIEAAVSAARSLDGDFVLVARADGIMNGQYGLDEAIARVQRYEEVGADCVYVPLPASFDDLATICRSVTVPVNVLAAGPYARHRIADFFAAVGAARISVGSALARVTHRALVEAGRSIFSEAGDFEPLADSIAGSEVDRLLTGG